MRRVLVKKEREKCWNCKGRGWADAFTVDGKYVGRETCTVCGGEKGWPVLYYERRP